MSYHGDLSSLKVTLKYLALSSTYLANPSSLHSIASVLSLSIIIIISLNFVDADVFGFIARQGNS